MTMISDSRYPDVFQLQEAAPDVEPLTGSDDPVTGLVRTLYGFGSALGEMPDKTEAEFLSIGSKLNDYYDKATGISKLSSSAAELLSGEGIDSAVEGLSGLLERMSAYVKDSEAGTEKRVEKFKHTLSAIGDIKEELDEFARISKTLRSLGFTTMVYSAPTENRDQGFMVLAKNIKGLSDSIYSRSVTAVAELKVLSTTVNRAMERVHSVKEKQYTRMHLVLRQITSSLKSLEKRHKSASAAFSHVSDWSKDISQNIERAVMSAQFQDITRQKFEGVKQSIDGLCERLTGEYGNGVNSHDGQYGQGIEDELGRFCEQQVVSLFDARGSFVSAVTSIMASLRDIASSVTEMSERMHEMTGSAGEDGQSFLEDMGDSLATVKSSLSEIFEADMEVSRAAASVGSEMGRISSLVDEIEEIGDDVNIIALNAAVKSSQNGKKGSALGVLAKSIQDVSAHSTVMTSSTAQALRSVTWEVGKLSTDVTREIKGTFGEAQRIEEEMESMINALESLNGNVGHILEDIDRKVRSLSAEIALTVSETTSQKSVDKIIGRVVSGLSKIAEEGGRFIPNSSHWFGKDAEGETTGMTSLYRTVDSALEGTPNEEEHSGGGGDAEFGNNVELF
jgi:methyl-accepting chemotaxis protein